jgi:hypothetical protein
MGFVSGRIDGIDDPFERDSHGIEGELSFFERITHTRLANAFESREYISQ